jgi:hypothetical protein
MVTAMSLHAQVLDAVKAGATSLMIKPISFLSISKNFDDICLCLEQRGAL